MQGIRQQNSVFYGKEQIKRVYKVDMSTFDANTVNTRKVKYTRDEELLVTDNYKIEVIKAPGCFKLFKCGKKFFDNLDVTYERACMANEKENYWEKMYDTITKYNNKRYTPLSNVKIR